MRYAKQLLSVTAVTLVAACTDNGIFNPRNDAAGTYQITVYAGRSIPATFTIQPGDPDFPTYPNGGTFVVTDGQLVLDNNGTFDETNVYVITPPGGPADSYTFVRTGTWTLNGTDLTLSIPAQNGNPSRVVYGTLTISANNRYTVNYQEDSGGGNFESYEYQR